MDAQPGRNSHQERALESLATESQVPIGEVARLYADQRAQLEVGARVTGFLPILAIRRVREMLRRRNAGEHTPL